MVENAALKVHAWRKLASFVEIFVNGVATGEQSAADLDLIADFQRANDILGNWCLELNHDLKQLKLIGLIELNALSEETPFI